MNELGVRQPAGAMVQTRAEAEAAAAKMGFPLLVRPSYVLGGRAMAICFDEREFEAALDEALRVSEQHPVLMDRFLAGAVEYDVDALCDGKDVYIAGVMEHIEEAGVHSGDSSCVMPPVAIRPKVRAEMEAATRRIALRLGVVGLMNVQWAVQDDTLYVLEVNPRASRTVPYVSKATGVPLARLATQLCLGKTLAELGPLEPWGSGLFFIKAPVFPWRRFTVDDIVLGPEMKSTGEVMGVGRSFGEAYAKALIGAGMSLPREGCVFLSLRDADKASLADIAGPLYSLGFELMATSGTAAEIRRLGVPVETVFKVREGRPDIVDHVRKGRVQLMINTPLGRKGLYDEAAMRLAGLRFGVPCITTLRGAQAVVAAIRSLRADELRVVSLQEVAQAAGEEPSAP
jgi:carbamoyl-phosphate synthase large subunit